jgi:hypothetical protein
VSAERRQAGILNSFSVLGVHAWARGLAGIVSCVENVLRRCRASLPSLYGSPPLAGVLCIVRIDSKAYSLNNLVRSSFPIVAEHVTPKSNY